MALVDQRTNTIEERIPSFFEPSRTLEYEGFISKIRSIISTSQELILPFPFRISRGTRYFCLGRVSHRSLMIWRCDGNIDGYARELALSY